MIPVEFSVDETVQYASAQFEAGFNGSEVWAARAGLTSATIAHGLLDAGLSPLLVSAIAGGVIDEVELRVSMEGGTEKVTSVVRGRDAGALAAEAAILVTYSVKTIPPVPPKDSFAPGFPQLPRQPGLTEPEVIYVGPGLSARYICEDLARRAGLSCIYEAPNYQLLEDFTTTGTVLESMLALVEPFSHFEPSKVDVEIEGTQIRLRPRNIASPGTALSVADTRLSNLMVRSRIMGRVRVLRLTGGVAIHPRFLNVDPGEPVDDSGLGASIGEIAISENTDETTKDGRVVARVVTQETRRVRDRALLVSHEDAYLETTDNGIRDLRHVSAVDVTSDWERLELGYPNRIINSPKELRRTSVTEGRREIQDPEAKISTWVWEPQLRVIIEQRHDTGLGFLRFQTTTTETWDPENRKWDIPVIETKSYRVNGANTYDVTTTQYDADGTPKGHKRTTAGGPPPGGPGRRADGRDPAPPTRQPGDQTPIPGIPVTYAAIVDATPGRGARDFSLRNANLLRNELEIIASQAQAASGRTEVELSFVANGIPWLHRGLRLELTGLDSETGGTIALAIALVTECKTEYREGQFYRSYVKACWWE